MSTNEKSPLLALMLFQRERTVAEVAQRLGIHTRTIYRYLHYYREAGMTVDRPAKGIYRVSIDPQSSVMLNE